jgi:hypothetical protein
MRLSFLSTDAREVTSKLSLAGAADDDEAEDMTHGEKKLSLLLPFFLFSSINAHR